MKIIEKEEKRKHKQINLCSDLLVVGGGLSGVCCAITAARNGVKVILVQDRPVLGGNASSEIRVWALGATSHMGNNNRWAREGGVIDEIMVENLYRNKEGNPLVFDSLLYDKVINESNITLLLNTVVFDLKKEANTLVSVIAFNPQNQTAYEMKATYFCDASGDGILGYLSGASYRVGAEEAEEFNEGFSPSEEYGELLGHTIFLYTKKTDAPVKYVAPSFAIQDMSVIPKLNQITPDQFGCNYWWFEYGGTKDTVYDTEEIKLELWKVVYGAWNHIKNSGLYPEAENLTLEWVGVIPGKRESRRFEGLYMLTQHDIIQQKYFEDSVAFGGWAIDLHPAEGVYSSKPSCNQYHSVGVYGIPYRSYVNKDIENLFMVGRLISVSHVAFGSTRVMITSAHGGQAVGMATSLCCKYGCLPKDLLEQEKMKELQYLLSYNGQSIPHVAIETEKNLLLESELSPSSTLQMSGLSFDGEWRNLDISIGQLLPLNANTRYTIEIELNATEASNLVVELVVSSKPFNYTPNELLESKTYSIPQGISRLEIPFKACLSHHQYAFLILRRNPSISVRTSNQRVTGILSTFNKFNKAVNNYGRQIPPEGSGFESFEFFTPERRPGGQNIAFHIQPVLTCFTVDNVLNGYVRPYLSVNAWVASFDDARPTIEVDLREEKEVQEIKIFFDTDYDHPMETIQWGHFESEIPFCVKKYQIYNGDGELLYEQLDNHQTINLIKFDAPVTLRHLKFVFHQEKPEIPVAVYQIEIH